MPGNWDTVLKRSGMRRRVNDEIFQFQYRASPRAYRRAVWAAFDYAYAPKRWINILVFVLLIAPFISWLAGVPNLLFWTIECDSCILIYAAILYLLLTNVHARRKKTKRSMIYLRKAVRDKRIRKAYYFPISVTLDGTGMCVDSPGSKTLWPWSRCIEVMLRADGIAVAVRHPLGMPLIYSFPPGAFANLGEKCRIANQMQSWILAAKETDAPKASVPWLAIAWISARTLWLVLTIAAWLLAYDAWVGHVSSPPTQRETISITGNQPTPPSHMGIITHSPQEPAVHSHNSQAAETGTRLVLADLDEFGSVNRQAAGMGGGATGRNSVDRHATGKTGIEKRISLVFISSGR